MSNRIARLMVARILRAGGAVVAPTVTFLLRDDFTTDDAAPVTSPRTCEPGPGTLTATNEGRMSISSQVLSYSAAAGLMRLSENGGYSQLTGRAMLAKWTPTNTLGWINLGYDNNNSGNAAGGITLRTFGSLNVSAYPIGPTLLIALSTNTLYDVFVIANGSRGYLVIDDTLVLVWPSGLPATLYPCFVDESADGTGQIETIRIFDLASPWDTVDGIATQILSGARAPGDTWIHEADHLTYATITTLPSADQIEMRLRMQDTSNYWQATVDSTGALDLDEVVAGTPTQRGTAAGVVTAGERINWVAAGNTIAVYDSTARRINYASAANFSTETDGELETEGTNGAVTGIEVYPRTLPAAAVAELEKYSEAA